MDYSQDMNKPEKKEVKPKKKLSDLFESNKKNVPQNSNYKNDKNTKLAQAKKIAKEKNIKNWETLKVSSAKDKRFSIISPEGKKINFGQFPFKGEGTFIDHNDEQLKRAWQARHSKIMKDGKPAYLNKESPEFYSWNLLWN
jgi:hypothetical protein